MGIVASDANSVPASSGRARWQWELQRAVRDPSELARLLHLPDWWVAQARRAAQRFPLLAPHPYIARMRPRDPADPLLRQVAPVPAELEEVAGFTEDPVGELQCRPAPGVLHKYAGRALLLVTGACAVHCRYCFRRHFPYAGHAGPGALASAIHYLQNDPSIHEVILSGGDPLTLPDTTLARLVQRLAAIPHLQTLRIHTRLPIVIPSRITSGLLRWLAATRLQRVVVLHANHPAELDGGVERAVARLRRRNVLLLNQAVLLRGVNDSVQTLESLSRRLMEIGVLPYYLHQLDRVAGAAHFEVPVSESVALWESLRRRLPGYLVPRLVREEPGAPAKTWLLPRP